MRIVLDLQACQASSTHRGIGRYSLSLAQAMARNSGAHELRIVLNAGFGASVAPLRQAFETLLPPERIGTYVLPAQVAGFDPANAWRRQAAERMREHYLATLRPDVVHVASLFEGFGDDAVSSVLHGDGRFDTAVTLYDLIPLVRKQQYLSDPALRAWYYRKLQSMKNAELLLAISSHSRSEALAALQLADDSVVNISSAVDDIFRPRPCEGAALDALRARYGLRRPYLMYTGGIDHRKNIDGLITAYAALPGPLRRQYQLAIVCKIGAGDRARLTLHARKLGLAEDELVLTDFVPDDDLVALYNATALFVFPSLQEGFGLPALEAMACGVPVIGANNSSIPEVIGRTDALFDPLDPGAIAASMAKVLGEPDFAASLRAHGLQQAKKFSWDASARAALAAFEQLHQRRRDLARSSVTPCASPRARPRLAFVAPLPPQRTGIAGYSAELLPELAKYFEIDLILAQDSVSDDWAGSNFPRRTVAWFDQHAERFDHVLYQFGNAPYHQHMFALLRRHPGIVVLHDFYLSAIVSYAAAASDHPNEYCRTLYLAHGYKALAEEAAGGRAASQLAYPCNRAVLTQAAGVIVHSAHAAALAEQWYGPGSASGWRQIPLLRAMPGTPGRMAARRALGIADDAFVVCSFGMLAASKCNERIVEAWIGSALDADPRCQLVFVGENSADPFGAALAACIAAHPRVRITGFASEQDYRLYLAAADAAVQLRAHSRGETSATVLDCLAHQLPTIVNAHGSAAELPDEVCVRLPDQFENDALRAALERLRADGGLRDALAQRAGHYMHQVHHPARVGAQYRDAIVALSAASPVLAYRALLASVACIDGAPSADDLRQAAAAIAANEPASGPRQLLIDVTDAPADAVWRGQLAALVLRAAPELRIEPIVLDAGQYRYARRFTLALIGRTDLVLDDAPVDVRAGDLLLARDNASEPVRAAWGLRGVHVCSAEQAIDAPGLTPELARALAALAR